MSTCTIAVAVSGDNNVSEGPHIIIANQHQIHLADTYQLLMDHDGVRVYFHKILTTTMRIIAGNENDSFFQRALFVTNNAGATVDQFHFDFINNPLTTDRQDVEPGSILSPQIEAWMYCDETGLHTDFILENAKMGDYDFETVLSEDGYYKTILVHDQKAQASEWCSIC